ncbi:MAG: arylsulfatase [Pirellulaceae bacterium]
MHVLTSRLMVVVLSLVLVGVINSLQAEETRPPNIIWIMPDDLGYGDVGYLGQKQVKTPHIDRLASEGMRLDSFYAGNTVCRPSRLVLWTGLHSGHTAINSNRPYVFSDTDVTVASRLKEAGYTTGGVGKWAMGNPGTGGEPIHHGFDFWYGYLDQSEAHNFYPTHLYRCADGEVNQEELPGNVLLDDPKARGRVAKPEHRDTYSHDLLTEEALGFIRDNHEKPFALHVHWTIPHTNNEGGRVLGDGMEVPDYGQYKDQDWPNTEKGFAAMVSRMDGDVGRIIDLLKELKIEQNTLVIFTSDNGPHNEGGHKHTFFNSNGPLRGFKRDVYEGGIRVPTIAYWPGTIQPGTKSDTPFTFYDYMATACDLTGAKIPEKTDGISFLPTLLGKSEQQTAREAIYSSYEKKQAVRMGQWKGVRLAPNRLIELYDLSTDIGEEDDVAEDHPEIVRRIAQEMEKVTR